MGRTYSSLAAAALLSAVATLVPSTAQAGIDACGNIDVRAEAQCELVTQGGCTARCEPVRFQAACAADLYVDCDGRCNVEPPECNISFEAECAAACKVDPGSFDCKGTCEARCDANCSGKCASSGDKTQCEASCKATCSGECDVSCEATPPSATCEAKCKASYSASCKANANIDCQVNCQASGFAKCEADLQGGCKAQCTKPEGALFCDGQYVDTGDNLQKCIDALNAYLNVKVQASGSASCTGNECTAEGKATATCAAAPAGEDPASPVLLGLGVAVVLGSTLRRRRRG